MERYRILILCLLLFASLGEAQTNSITFSFTIPPGSPDTATSAAVLDSAGVMVRTLWGNRSYPPGTYSGTWDGKLDVSASSMPGNKYTIKLLADNVSYTYDGEVLTTNRDWYGPNRWGWQCGWTQGFPKLAFSAARGWMMCGYNEGSMNFVTFDKNNPNYPTKPHPYYANGNHGEYDVATDNQWVYLLAEQSSVSFPNNFVTAVDANSGVPVYFSSGTLDNSLVWSNTSSSGWFIAATYIDYVSGAASQGTGIAVQRSGNVLAVAHGNQNTIKLFDKRTGASLGPDVTTVPNLGKVTPMAFTSEGLWVVATGQLYLITGLPSSPVVSQPISGLSYPVSVGANTLANNLFVADGGTAQQVIEYAPNTHTVMRKIGDAGSYNDCNPSVTHTRLLLDDAPITGINGNNLGQNSLYYVWVAADDEDHVWIQDQRGQRVQHFDQASNYVEQILNRKPNYWLTVSETLPNRLFSANWMEFTVDYTVPLVPGDPDTAVGGNGAWTLSKNWMVCAAGSHGSTAWTGADMYFVRSVEQLSNGRVYAVLDSHGGTGPQRNIFELPANGTSPARNTGVNMLLNAGMNRNGDITITAVNGSGVGRAAAVMVNSLTGFDGSNNPIYGAQTTQISVPTDSTNWILVPQIAGYSNGVEATTGGYYPIFKTTFNNNGIAVGSPSWSSTSPKFGSQSMSAASDANYIAYYTMGQGSARQWTIEAWLKTTATGTQAAVSYGTTTGGNVWMGSSGGKFAFGIDGTNGFDGTTQATSITINDGAWHHCVLEMTNANNITQTQIASTYVDGAPGPTLTGSVSAQQGYPVGTIGRATNTTGMAWTGNIDEVALFVYPKYTASFTPPTAAYSGGEYGVSAVWHMDGGPYVAGNALGAAAGQQFTTRYPHAAAIRSGYASYAWTTLPEVCMNNAPDFKGGYPCDTAGYGGITPVHVEGRTMLFYYGGNWTPYGAQFYHLYEDGMMIGQFGNNQQFPGVNISPQPLNLNYPMHPGNIGNSSWITTTTINSGNDIYVYVGDEALTPGHRWHISNLGAIHEYTGTATLQPNAQVTLSKVF
jgi:hypothetical protein